MLAAAKGRMVEAIEKADAATGLREMEGKMGADGRVRTEVLRELDGPRR